MAATHRIASAIVALMLAVSLCSCTADRIGGAGSRSSRPAATDGVPGPGQRGPTPACTDSIAFDCDFQNRFAAVQRYLSDRPGSVGIEVHDRATGARWGSDDAGRYVWTASTIKAAIAVNLLQRNRSGEIQLSDDDWDAMARMITESDNDATDYLWSAFGQLPSEAYRDYGLPDLMTTVDEIGEWGSELASAGSMAGLLDYALESLYPQDKQWLVTQLRSVVQNQRWGLLDLDSDARPGAKNGWDEEPTGWVVNSVGFVGPRQRYTVAIMNDLGEDGGYDDGVETVSTVAQLLFAGRF